MSQELTHYGIKGMKWGHRKNGYSYNSTQPSSNTGDPKVIRRASRKALTSMTDEDLNRSNDRLRREAEYRRLNSRGDNFVKDILKSSTKPVATAVLTGSAMYGVHRLANSKNTTVAKVISNIMRSNQSSDYMQYINQAWKKKMK